MHVSIYVVNFHLSKFFPTLPLPKSHKANRYVLNCVFILHPNHLLVFYPETSGSNINSCSLPLAQHGSTGPDPIPLFLLPVFLLVHSLLLVLPSPCPHTCLAQLINPVFYALLLSSSLSINSESNRAQLIC